MTIVDLTHWMLVAAGDQAGQAHAARPGSDPSAVWPMVLWIVRGGVCVLVAGIVMCLYRILRGPTLADRVLSADVLALMLVGLVILLIIETDNTVFIDAALIVAIIGFASTVAFAQYIGDRPQAGGQSDVKRAVDRETQNQ